MDAYDMIFNLGIGMFFRGEEINRIIDLGAEFDVDDIDIDVDMDVGVELDVNLEFEINIDTDMDIDINSEIDSDAIEFPTTPAPIMLFHINGGSNKSEHE